jgi:Fe-S cluster biogenesis protein NfuA
VSEDLRNTVQRRVNSISRVFGSHGGGLKLEAVGNDGHAEVSFTGMCTGCPYRPVCTGVTVEPALREVSGVTAVTVTGSRISDVAAERFAAGLRGE